MSTIERAMRQQEGLPPAPETAAAAPASAPEFNPEIRPSADAAATASRLHLDFEQLRQLGYLVPGDPAERLSEEFQQIKRRIIGNTVPGMLRHGRAPNLVLVTSAIPGEGKTYTTMNLALSIAMEIDRRVLAVDSDIMKSDLSRLFGAWNKPGLYDLLMHPALDAGEIIARTNVPGLSFMPAGTVREGITERLASQAMVRLVGELAERYADRLILFDAAPVLAMSGAAALAPLMGQVVMVVEAARTSREMLTRALAALEHAEVTGVVLNKIRHRREGSAYGYAYGHAYAGAQPGVAA